jgi:3-oxoacyl-[acyl-carrier protein] reductase
MDLGLTGSRALVTAASSGLGFATAHALAREGARVAICSRDGARAEAAAERIAADTGASVHAFVADVAVTADLERLVAAAERALGGLDVLVNNAGGPPTGGFDSLDDDDWRRGFELTLMSVVRTTRLALPLLERSGGGSVLTLLSSSVKQPIPNLLISNVYRPGLAGLTKSLAIDLAPRGIRVNGLAPGRIGTERTHELNAALAERQGTTPEEVMRASVANIPMGRLGRPEEFGRVAAFLCSPAASYVTGHVMIVDGGSVRAL